MIRRIQDFKFEYLNQDHFADVEVFYHLERNYGSDADGNRGECRIIIDDIVVLRIYLENGMQVLINGRMLDCVDSRIKDFSWI